MHECGSCVSFDAKIVGFESELCRVWQGCSIRISLMSWKRCESYRWASGSRAKPCLLGNVLYDKNVFYRLFSIMNSDYLSWENVKINNRCKSHRWSCEKPSESIFGWKCVLFNIFFYYVVLISKFYHWKRFVKKIFREFYLLWSALYIFYDWIIFNSDKYLSKSLKNHWLRFHSIWM